ncbi:unannotated protein [freshwater metagenome]|uniref:Unannotated protein n=1 Tax=freshwater metagenome TaxID=449393 RepID=A0A6J6ZP12_9ZZZZ
MNQSMAIIISIFVVFAAVTLIGKKFNLSSRYERKPRVLNSWNALDKGIDPTDENKA